MNMYRNLEEDKADAMGEISCNINHIEDHLDSISTTYFTSRKFIHLPKKQKHINPSHIESIDYELDDDCLFSIHIQMQSGRVYSTAHPEDLEKIIEFLDEEIIEFLNSEVNIKKESK